MIALSSADAVGNDTPSGAAAAGPASPPAETSHDADDYVLVGCKPAASRHAAAYPGYDSSDDDDDDQYIIGGACESANRERPRQGAGSNGANRERTGQGDGSKGANRERTGQRTAGTASTRYRPAVSYTHLTLPTILRV